MPRAFQSHGRRYKGYDKPFFSWINPGAKRFSNARLLIIVIFVGIGVWLLTWGLSLTQVAP